MANNTINSKQLTSGWTAYLVARNSAGLIYDAALADGTVTAINTIAAADAKIAMTEAGTSGQYSVAIPAELPVGIWDFSIRRQTGGSPVLSPTDPEQEIQTWYWDGTHKHHAAMYHSVIDQEAVPTSRVYKLLATADEGLVGAAAKSMNNGKSVTFALDFSADLPTNGRVASIGTPSDNLGSGLAYSVVGVDKHLAKVRVTASAVGIYTVSVPVTYDTGVTRVGTVTLEVA